MAGVAGVAGVARPAPPEAGVAGVARVAGTARVAGVMGSLSGPITRPRRCVARCAIAAATLAFAMSDACAFGAWAASTQGSASSMRAAVAMRFI